jgi:cyclic pyranopterin phosphate synthase
VPSNHFDDDGNVHMVDVAAKPVTKRVATASSRITMNATSAALVRKGTSRKGDVLAVARLAAINATKWTSHLIPLCHSIPIEAVQIDFHWAGETLEGESVDDPAKTTHQLICRVTCATSGKTGIEMEAMTAASVGALAVYDMLKSVDREMRIGPTQLEEKSGGSSGSFSRETGENPPQTTCFVDPRS